MKIFDFWALTQLQQQQNNLMVLKDMLNWSKIKTGLAAAAAITNQTSVQNILATKMGKKWPCKSSNNHESNAFKSSLLHRLQIGQADAAVITNQTPLKDPCRIDYYKAATQLQQQRFPKRVRRRRIRSSSRSSSRRKPSDDTIRTATRSSRVLTKISMMTCSSSADSSCSCREAAWSRRKICRWEFRVQIRAGMPRGPRKDKCEWDKSVAAMRSSWRRKRRKSR